MKARTKGFLNEEQIDHNSEQFDYITELHSYLWRFVRSELPGVGGHLEDYIDLALLVAEKRTKLNKTK